MVCRLSLRRLAKLCYWWGNFVGAMYYYKQGQCTPLRIRGNMLSNTTWIYELFGELYLINNSVNYLSWLATVVWMFRCIGGSTLWIPRTVKPIPSMALSCTKKNKWGPLAVQKNGSVTCSHSEFTHGLFSSFFKYTYFPPGAMSQCAGSPRRIQPSTSMITSRNICISLPTFNPRTGLMMSQRHKKSNQSNEYWELVMSMCMMSQSSSNCFRLSPWWYSLGICAVTMLAIWASIFMPSWTAFALWDTMEEKQLWRGNDLSQYTAEKREKT